MKTIEAFWEERNVGEKCFEVEVESKDSIADILQIIHSRPEKYFVAKVPSGNTDALFALQRDGFIFMEMNIQTKFEITEKPSAPAKYQKLIDRVNYHEATTEEVEQTISEIRKGDLFSTDKIALDPHYSKKIAGQRYAFWTEDVLESGKAHLLIVEFDNNPIGFTVMIDKGSYYEGFLGSVYKDYLNSGLGFAIAVVGPKYAYENGCKKIISGVSSNNFQMLKFHALAGAKVNKLTYVLVKHI